ncbi:MAG: MBL fold metallo-hydrolase [Gemmatimonadetes bacterium]|jgi:glyoxylase-like metal-dependent hydrolase (beta-lactamase superfamily II)|nr:MBL fold metallo-hydrolase [Gemmatimonadota bacterium]
MDRRYPRKKYRAVGLFPLLYFLVLSILPTIAQEHSDPLTITHVRGNIYMLQGPGGNVALSLGDDGTLLVDSKFADVADQIRTVIDSLNGGEIGYILNTHFHGDHIGGNKALGQGAPIIAHRNVRRRLLTRPSIDQRYVPPTPESDWPTLTFDRTLSIYFNGEEIRAVHFDNGHTDGDIAVFFTDSNVIHLGDLFFNQLFPFVDLDYGGDVENLARHIDQLADSLPADSKIIPGHGPLATLDDLQTYRRMLQQTLSTVREGIAAGKSIDQIQSEGLAEQWTQWAWPYVPARRWLGIVYWSLAAPRQ